jgi:hypothetical protein
MKEWLENKIYILSTPLGGAIGCASLLLGILIGKMLLSMGGT